MPPMTKLLLQEVDVEAAVVNDHTLFEARPLPARSLTPVVIVAV